MDVPEGFEKLEGAIYRRGEDLLVVGVLDPEGPFSIALKLAQPGAEDPGPAPDGFEWTGELRPPKKGEYFWSEIKGQVVRAIEDETGVNRLGEPTGGRRILRPLARPEPEKPKRGGLRLVKE